MDSGQNISDAILYAQEGRNDRLKAWLEQGGNPNQYDPDGGGWTPLLWAAARGNAETVKLLLDGGADINMRQQKSGALAVHMAGHSGDVGTATTLLDFEPDHLNEIWDLNGHTILLQAVFYGHLDLADMLVKRGADTSITTARGLGAYEFANQFQNHPMMEIIRPYDSSAEAKATYYESFLKRIAPQITESEKQQQALSDQLVALIQQGISRAAQDPGSVDETLAQIKALVLDQNTDVNRLGGPLQQPPLIVTVTGNNGLPANPAIARLRNEVAAFLLEQGADPTRHEEHPMGAQTIIRAAVFNHLEILKMCSNYISAQSLADAINEYPVVNGLTAMHDTVLRATMADADHFDGYLEQARWFVAHGGRTDIKDFAGITQREIALNCKDEKKRTRLLEALDQ